MKTDNELIAEFIGNTRRYESTHQIFVANLKYHKSWDWLMPVVDKIESLGYSVTLYSGGTQIFQRGNAHGTLHNYETKIESTYKAVVEFIKSHNEKIEI